MELNVEKDGDSAVRVNFAEQKRQVLNSVGGQEGGGGACHLIKAWWNIHLTYFTVVQR